MRQLLAGMSPRSGVSQVPRALHAGLHALDRRLMRIGPRGIKHRVGWN